MTAPRIALISATPLAIGPAEGAVREALPEAAIWNLLDDRLLADARSGPITDDLAGRMDSLIDIAIAGRADGVILTCSQYGQRALVRDRKRDGVAVLSADGPLFDEVVARRPRRVVLVASLESAIADSAPRLAALLAAAGLETSVEPVLVPAPTSDEAVRSLEDAVGAHVASADVIALAQYSLAPFASRLEERLGKPVLDGPHVAVDRLIREMKAAA
ncbi:hypothetical protein R2Q81_05250 [Microbacterium aquimaris]|uniref:hypothetical protein n=1 Tax=Microbacterium aquimaris TaxID=459816 RepID=UPI002AD48A6B|nr:hypothetical protein [Microbacterium aquimaris]MDZ8275358.1 hypothetical protein [Microbacterium aquimaris]